jgi:hypothetical protein
MTICKGQVWRHWDVSPSEVTLASDELASAPRPLPAIYGRRGFGTYAVRAALHPYNLLFLCCAIFLSLISWSAAVLVAGAIVEAFYLAVVPLQRGFRSRVDERIDEYMRAIATEARKDLVAQMTLRHQKELASIELLIDKTRENMRRQGGAVPLVLDDSQGSSRLTTRYIRLAIAHKACEESIGTTSKEALEEAIRTLQAAYRTSSERVGRLLQRRVAIATRRTECWSRARENLEAIAHQLGAILEVIHLMHEQSMAPVDSQGMCRELDRFMQDLEESDGAMRELAELPGLGVDAHLEIQELQMGEALTRRVAG